MSGRSLIALAAAAAAALIIAYLAAGGSAYEPTPSADPCLAREWRSPEGVEEIAQQFALSALDGAACELGVTREELAVGLVTEESRAEFAEAQGIDEAALEAAVQAGLVRAIDDAVEADALSPAVAAPLRELAVRLPVDEAVSVIADAGELFAAAGDLLDGLADRLEGVVPGL